MTVISNSSPLITLANAKRLHLLQGVFEEVIIPYAVYDEVVVQGRMRPGAENIAAAQWVVCRQVENQAAVQNFRGIHRCLGPGEAETIILAKQLMADWVIIDEVRGRRAAAQEGLKLIGTIGVVILAKELALIASVQNVLDDFVRAGFRLSSATYQAALEKAGEA